MPKIILNISNIPRGYIISLKNYPLLNTSTSNLNHLTSFVIPYTSQKYFILFLGFKFGNLKKKKKRYNFNILLLGLIYYFLKNLFHKYAGILMLALMHAVHIRAHIYIYTCMPIKDIIIRRGYKAIIEVN